MQFRGNRFLVSRDLDDPTFLRQSGERKSRLPLEADQARLQKPAWDSRVMARRYAREHELAVE